MPQYIYVLDQKGSCVKTPVYFNKLLPPVYSNEPFVPATQMIEQFLPILHVEGWRLCYKRHTDGFLTFNIWYVNKNTGEFSNMLSSCFTSSFLIEHTNEYTRSLDFLNLFAFFSIPCNYLDKVFTNYKHPYYKKALYALNGSLTIEG